MCIHGYLDPKRSPLPLPFNPQVQWFQNNLLLRNNSDFKQSFNGVVAKLVITDPYSDDTGTYMCVAKSIAGEAKTSCNVTVKGTSMES